MGRWQRLSTGLALLGLSVLSACGVEYAPAAGGGASATPADRYVGISRGDRDSPRRPRSADPY